MYPNALLSIAHWSPYWCIHYIEKDWTEYCVHCANKLTYSLIHAHTQKVNLQSFGKPVLFREQNKFFGHAYVCIFDCCCTLYSFIHLFVCLSVYLCACYVFWSSNDHFIYETGQWPLGTSCKQKVHKWKIKWKYAPKSYTQTYCKLGGLNPVWVLIGQTFI